MASVTQSTYNDGKTYEQIMQEMQNAGIKTTHIRQGREADFEDYGNALSSDVKHMLMDSFDCEQDYVLQQRLAGMFTGRNALQFNQFVSGCKSMGLSISRESVKTTYISDYKGGNFSNSIRKGSITVYTISDGKGGEIKIADTNGNGAIESEELFMNQILGDLNMELSGVTPVSVGSGGGGGGANGVAGAAETKETVSQEDYNNEVEKYLQQGYSKTESELKAGIKLNALTLSYTGSMQSNQEIASQSEYNTKVEMQLLRGSSLEEAERRVNEDLGIETFSYTGTVKDKTKDDKTPVKDKKESTLLNKFKDKKLKNSKDADELINTIKTTTLIRNENKINILSMIKDNKEAENKNTNPFEDTIFKQELKTEIEKAIQNEENFFNTL